MDLHLSFEDEIPFQKTVASEDDRESFFSALFQESLEIGDDGSPFLKVWVPSTLLHIIFQHVDHNDCRFHKGASLLGLNPSFPPACGRQVKTGIQEINIIKYGFLLSQE
jgi:hypothetical protein